MKAPTTAGNFFQEKSSDKLIVRAEGNQIALVNELRESLPNWIEVSSLAGPLAVKAHSVSPRKFSGRLRIESRAGRLFIFNILSLEDYVSGVLPSEVPGDFPLEALKAQAVLARTYAVTERGRHAKQGFDLCDLTHCQVYGGLPGLSSKQAAAVHSIQGKILTYQGRPATVFFHSTCAGHTSPHQRVFGGRPLPYLQGISDQDYCAASPHLLWQSELPLSALTALLKPNGLRGEMVALRAQDREAGGRVFELELISGQRVPVSAMDFLSWVGRSLGWNQLKSNWFEVEVTNGMAYFKGRGLGHGVGLCQWGAKGRAEAGMKFPEILQAYFPGTRLEKIFR